MKPRSNSSNWLLYAAIAILIVVLLGDRGIRINPSVNGTPISVSGVQLQDATPTAPLTITAGPGVDIMATANYIALETLMAQGAITPTETLLPGETPTLGPTPTLQPLILQLGDINATLNILRNIQIGYESSTVVAGSKVGCDAQVSDVKQVQKTFFTVPFVGYQFGISPENSQQQATYALCVTIKTGWQFSDLRLDLNKSVIGDFVDVGTPQANPANGQMVVTQKPTAQLVIVATRPACVSATHIGKGDQQFAFSKTPSANWFKLAPVFGVNYAQGLEADFNNMYQIARANALSLNNLKEAREQSNISFAPGGKLYVDLQNLIAQTGNWASFTLTTEILGDQNAPYIFCEDGSAVQ